MSNLYELRAKAHADATRFIAENNKVAADRALDEVSRLTEEIRKSESRSLDLSTSNYAGTGKEKDRSAAFGKWLRGKPITDAEKRDITEGTLASHVGTYTGLGFFVPTGFSNQVEQATKWFAPVLDIFGRIDTATGNPLPYPISNDTAATASIVGEGANNAEADGAGGNFGTSHIIFGAYKYTSGLVKCSMELLQDSFFDIEAWLAERFGERFGRRYELDLTQGLGSGSGQPLGILPAIIASGVAPVVAQGSSESSGGSETGVNSIGWSDLVNLEHSVDPSYRRRAKYMLHDLTLSRFKRVLDKFGRPLWTPGVTATDPDRINGYEYVVNQSMPQIAASANTVVFGDLTKYKVRKVKGGMNVQRLNERYAELGETGFLALDRLDANLLDAGTHPCNLLQQHS